MASFLGHLVLLVLAGFALFRLWRSTRSADWWLNAAIAAGFAVRALLGSALFWISYLHLPIARTLQKGDGLWFFAVDAFQYYPQALGAARAGVWTIITYDRTVAAVAFVQAFATSILLFGRVASAALILNAFCYLGAMWIIVRSTAQGDRARIAARIAVVAISLSPTFILWSLQPLKDTMFQFLVVAFVGACAAWQRLWSAPAHPRRATAVGVAMAAALFLLSALRWYFAFVVLVAAAAFAILVAFRAPRRKVSFVAAVLVLFILSRAFLYGAGPYVPPALHDVLTPSPNGHAITGVASMMGDGVEHAREGFERSGGATQIGLGGNLAKLDAKAAPPRQAEPSNPPRREAEAHVKPDAETRESSVEVADGKQSDAQPSPTVATATDAATEQAASTESSMPMASAATPPVDAPPATAAPVPAPTPSQAPAPAQASVEVQPPTEAPAQTPAPVHTAGSAPLTAAPEPSQTASVNSRVADPTAKPAPHSIHKRVASRKKTAKPPATVQASRVPTVSPAPPPPPAAVASSPAPQPAQRPIVVPASRVARLAAGTAAVLVPRGLGQRAGLFEIGGGKGLWWFSDIDTIVFDLIALFAVCLTWRWLRAASLRNPVFWLVAAITVCIAVPLVYTVTNFGTLLRLREMIYLGLLLIPLALATAPANLIPESAVEAEPQAGSGSGLPLASNASMRSL